MGYPKEKILDRELREMAFLHLARQSNSKMKNHLKCCARKITGFNKRLMTALCGNMRTNRNLIFYCIKMDNVLCEKLIAEFSKWYPKLVAIAKEQYVNRHEDVVENGIKNIAIIRS